VSKVSCFCQPAKAANELWIQGEQCAIAVGDMNGEGNLCQVKNSTSIAHNMYEQYFRACINRVQHCAHSIWFGTHLLDVDKVTDLILCSTYFSTH
jgi:hypothetical protein